VKKKHVPYLLLGLLLALLLVLVIRGEKASEKKTLDSRLSFRKRDKIPYGAYIAWQNLPSIFPGTRVATEAASPQYWSNLSPYEKNQALIIITPQFFPDESELKLLFRFIESGNDVFVSTLNCSREWVDALGFGLYHDWLNKMIYNELSDPDSMSVTLSLPSMGAKTEFLYPGHRLESWFQKIDSSRTRVLGHAANGRPNFVQMRAGKGNLFFHLSPLAFSNYFLLHKQNMSYYDQSLSLISDKVKTVVWDEYFLNKRSEQQQRENEDKGWLSTLLNLENADGKKSFKAAFWLLLAILLLYVLSEMRRKQRIIPVLKKPANDSLDFVKTIGRLYHDKGDHQNLCRKMSAYFLEHVRSRYKLPTQRLDEEFVQNLVYKTGAQEDLIRQIVNFIRSLDEERTVSAATMAVFHERLEQFYKNS
jgi:hypothetical protein